MNGSENWRRHTLLIYQGGPGLKTHLDIISNFHPSLYLGKGFEEEKKLLVVEPPQDPKGQITLSLSFYCGMTLHQMHREDSTSSSDQ